MHRLRERRVWISATLGAGWIAAAMSGVRAAETGEPTATASEILAALPLDVREELERKRQVVVQELGSESGAYGGRIRALVLFDLEPDEVFRLLSQPHRQVEWRPELLGFEEVSASPERRSDRYRLKMLFVKVAYHLDYRWDPLRARILWSLDPARDNDFETLEGSWDLYPLGSAQTLGRFATRLDVGGAIPKFVQDYASRRAVPSTLENCRRWVESRGEWRP